MERLKDVMAATPHSVPVGVKNAKSRLLSLHFSIPNIKRRMFFGFNEPKTNFKLKV